MSRPRNVMVRLRSSLRCDGEGVGLSAANALISKTYPEKLENLPPVAHRQPIQKGCHQKSCCSKLGLTGSQSLRLEVEWVCGDTIT